MRFSEAWLRQWVNPAIDTQALADQLSMAGLEVDAVDAVAAEFSGVVVGQVLSLEQHPNADKLRVCQVDAGSGAALQIICGAANVAAGMRVAVARVGAALPGGFKIKKAKLRGIESFGMICSAAELGMEEKSSGILPLPAEAPIGVDIRAYLQLDDHAIEVDLTPDRGDCLSLAGIAREVGVLNRSAVNPVAIETIAAQCDERMEVVVSAAAACPRYACRVLRDIDPSAKTPLWMVERLRRGGLRAISPVVDVTNYVLLELGQPMHGFDLALLQEKIHVRMALAGEKLRLLDGQEIALRPDTLVIADAGKALAMAGIMGGEDSAVTDGSRDILLESAFFAPLAISGKARSYGLNTDSAHRFERGVDPQLQIKALERATALLLEISGGRPGPIVEVVAPQHLPAAQPVVLRRERIRRVLGLTVDDATVLDILERLDMQVVSNDQGWQVTAPSCRFDIAIEEDLIEEIGRIYGYTEIPMSHAMVNTTMRAQPEAVFDLDRAKDLLVDRDYQEVVTYSFISPEVQRLIDPDVAPVVLANPLSADLSVMRTSLWSGLLLSAQYNRARQQERIRLFESGLRFIQTTEGLEQEPILAGLVMGAVGREHWDGASKPADFFDVKGDVQAVLSQISSAAPVLYTSAQCPALHPGQSARLQRGGEDIGRLGMLHPQLQAKFDLPDNVYLFELRLQGMRDGLLPKFSALSKFPSIRRDIALVLDRQVSYSEVRECVRAAVPPEILKDICLFDVYTGEKVDSSRKSLALGLILQDSSHTLTDDEVDFAVSGVLRSLEAEIGARLRD
jgi:phenylalanyl-tRNA synthetase beta chain